MIVIQEIDKQGEVLVWEGDLLNIAQELLTEFEHPNRRIILWKLKHTDLLRPVSKEPVHWFVARMNALNNGYTYKGWVK